MGKTFKKIGMKNGERVAIRSPKHKEGDIDIPYRCRCEYCMGIRKKKSQAKIVQQTIKEELDDLYNQ